MRSSAFTDFANTVTTTCVAFWYHSCLFFLLAREERKEIREEGERGRGERRERKIFERYQRGRGAIGDEVRDYLIFEAVGAGAAAGACVEVVEDVGADGAGEDAVMEGGIGVGA